MLGSFNSHFGFLLLSCIFLLSLSTIQAFTSSIPILKQEQLTQQQHDNYRITNSRMGHRTSTILPIQNSYYDFDDEKENDFFFKDLKSMSPEELAKYNAKYEESRNINRNQSLDKKQVWGQMATKTWNFMKEKKQAVRLLKTHLAILNVK